MKNKRPKKKPAYITYMSCADETIDKAAGYNKAIDDYEAFLNSIDLEPVILDWQEEMEGRCKIVQLLQSDRRKLAKAIDNRLRRSK